MIKNMKKNYIENLTGIVKSMSRTRPPVLGGEEREGEDAEREAAAWAAEHASSRSFYALHYYLCSGTSIP